MKAGDVCRCISNFNGVLPEELTVYKNDILQIHSVVDRHWVEAEGGGSVGRVPSSVLIQTDLPSCPPGSPLFVAAADFFPAQAGDLGFSRGDFIIGLNPIDEAWWCGEIYGKRGIFPLNFVWKVNEDILEVEDTSEKPVRKKGRVKMSLRAQLPEELDLYSGDIVNITHIVDNDWYRGESNGATGIFPSSFVEIIESSDVPSPSSTLSQQSSAPLEFFPSTGSCADPGSGYKTHGPESTVTSTDVPYDNTGHVVSSNSNLDAGFVVSQDAIPPNPPATLSKTSAHWKTIDTSDDMDVLDDDYFKQNMPGLFSSSNSNTSTLKNPNDSQTIIPPYSQASASESFSQLKPRYENVLGSIPSDKTSQNAFSTSSESYFVNKNSQCTELAGVKHRYENVNEDPFSRARSLPHESGLCVDLNDHANDQQLSALPNAQEDNFGDNNSGVLNSLTQKVDDYLSQYSHSDKNGVNEESNNNIHSNLIKQCSSMSSPGYNEDNTGIEPYGRAIFSFKAQYPNELTFKKGDIIHLLKHIDTHWTLGRLGSSRGLFPTSYVDIIVNCLYNEEEKFLARSETLLQSSYLGYAKAEYSFEGFQAGDVSMSKGDILKVIKYVDDNWVIVENLNGSKGMCPQNYLSVLFELNSIPEESQVSKSLSSEQIFSRESRQQIQSDPASRSRSTSPYNTSGSRRSYSKEDFGSIKQQAVDSVLAKNMASLDVACKSTFAEKKITESVFTEREVCEQKKEETMPPVIPPKISRTLSVGESKSKGPDKKPVCEKSESQTISSQASKIPPVPPRVNVKRNDSVKALSGGKEVETSAEISHGESLPKTPLEPIYSKVQKPPCAKKPSPKRLQLSISKKDGASASAQLSRGDSASSASFPDDVSSVSISSEGTYSTEANNGNTSPGILPQRPAPPPPPKACESGLKANEKYYSLPPTEEAQPIPMDRSDSEKLPSDAQESENNHRYEIIEGDDDDDDDGGAKLKAKVDIRRELMQEIVTTEHEYIHDLEALMQVIRLAPSQKESQSVDLNTLMGNISEVVIVAKKLLSHLDSVAYENDENLLIGRVFLLCAQDLCDVYKTYCSNHNVAAEPLLKKYIDEPEPAAFLQWVLSELQQHKIQLMDMRSVLIKPVQRVLKYPLFLDRLVSETPPGHADYDDIIEAKTKMANVAREINEYTKRLDLINKYRNAVDQSLQSKMQRVSMHSVVKKSARFSAIVSEKLGLMTTTKDPDFDEEETKFRCVQRAALALTQDAESVLNAIKVRHKSELEIAKALASTLIEGARTPAMEAVQRTTLESCNRILLMFESFVHKRISWPASQIVSLCEVPERLIGKRYHKLLDFDNAQYKLDRNKDPTRTRILEEELSQAKGNYEALNTQLMMELPILTNSGREVLILATRSLIAGRMYLQGYLAKLYLQMAQVPGLSYSGEEEMLAHFRVKYLHQVGEFRHLGFIPPESLQRTLPRARPRQKKSLDNTTVKKDASEGSKRKVFSRYPSDFIYVVTEVHTPGEVMELTLYPGDHVALLKNKDPLGSGNRWFVDDGDNKGFVRASCLKPVQGVDNRGGPVAALPSSINTAVPIPPQGQPMVAPRPSTLPRAAPNPPIPERPPRYEDLFPAINSAAPRPPTNINYRQNDPPPPPRYSANHGVTSLPTQTPLPTKPGHTESSTRSGSGTQVCETSYYSPPLDRQQSNDYNSPVSEESNIYEEIDQGKDAASEKAVMDEADGSPIYEVIEDGRRLSECDGATPLPEPELEEPQFYYALYNFGGSDSTQLNLVAGQVVLIVEAKSSDWWFVEDRNGSQGYVPASYLTKYT